MFANSCFLSNFRSDCLLNVSNVLCIARCVISCSIPRDGLFAHGLLSHLLRSSLWLQFKPHQIAAGAAYLAAKFLNMDLASYHNVWKEFETPPNVLKDIAQQLMELF
ncbi:unnamed protein product [Coffea canephora]|uniref:Cyclin C-terminal domain-containing protein n=1 Tax=Coffea canephora TaxID=49390 RepID=A0A068TRY8_COFCA|nr:unnamed protein product [Coffea canephora]